MFVIGMCISSGSAMALDLGGLLNQTQKIMQQQDQQRQQEQQRQETQKRQEAQQRQQEQQRPKIHQSQEAQQRQQEQQRQETQQRQEAQQRQQEQQRRQEQESFFASDPMACSAGFSQLPKSVEKLKSIKVAGFSAGPLACIEQQLLAKCEMRSYPAKGIFYYDAEARCSTESGSLDLMLFTTPSGPVISRMHLVADLQAQAAKNFFKDEPLFKNLVNKYGSPINIGVATEPYDVLVWSEGGYDHKAWKTALNNRSIAINILLKLNFSSALYEKQKTEVDRLKNQQVVVPKL